MLKAMGALRFYSRPVQPADDALAKSAQAAAVRAEECLQQVRAVEERCQEIVRQLATANERLSQLTQRESELRAVLERDVELERHRDHLNNVLDRKGTANAVQAAIEDARLHLEPCPYTVIDDLLPSGLYTCLLRGIPPVQLFANKPKGRQHLSPPFALAPMYSQRIWSYMATELVASVITPHIISKFRESIDAWISANWPDLQPSAVPLHGSGGRLMFNQRGYTILPHRDPKWGFLTCILYLARPGDSESWGTQLYAVDGDEQATSAAPYWIDPTRCRLAEDVAFRPNRLLVFLNSTGAHGAHIPDDQPEGLERYIYQFRIGPSTDTVSMLKSKLTEDRQPLWAGKARVDY